MSLYKTKPLLQKYRLAVIAMFVFFALSLVRELTGVDLLSVILRRGQYESFRAEASFIIGIMIVLALFLNKYLSADIQDGITNINIENSSNNEIIEEIMKYKFEAEIKNLREQIEKTQKELLKKSEDSLGREQRYQLIASLKTKLMEASSEEFLQEIKDKASRILESSTADRLRIHFERTIKRLLSEINVLEKRSRVNLIIGSLTAFAGVSIFMLFVFENPGDATAQAYLVTEFAPRISLVIVIELFAYFFLGLYKSNLSEIKYFHNELTNVEHKYLSLEESLASADQDTVKEIIKDIAKTERNFLLKKGESTVTLEDRRYTLEEQNSVINALVGKLTKTK